jgi:hypothetical protein
MALQGATRIAVAPEKSAAILPQADGAQFLRVYNLDMTTYPLPSDELWHSLKEGSEFFQHEGDIYETLRRLVDELDENGLDYALIGGLALVAHGYRRFTEDVDILMTPEALQVFRERLLGRGYLPAFSGATKTFRDTRTGVRIEVITTGDFPGDGKPKPIAFPDPTDARLQREGVWLITLDKLIELKLASGLSAPHRLKDLADVQELIARLKLPLELAEKLDASVREEYRRLWGNVQDIPTELNSC